MSSSPGLSRSYARANQELAKSFRRYLEGHPRHLSRDTIRNYADETAKYFVEFMGSRSMVEADHQVLREFLGSFDARGCSPSTLDRHAAGLRAFFRFLVLTGLTKNDPTLRLAHRKMPKRVPRVLTIAEVEALIAAARSPIERAVVEMLYATGVRVSELCNIRLENIDFAERIILVKKGKGGKDRYVLFGVPAAKAIRDYLDSRPSRTGFLFEMPARCGHVYFNQYRTKRPRPRRWVGLLLVNGVRRTIALGSQDELPTEQDARRKLSRITAGIPGYHPRPPAPYTTRAVSIIINKLARRAGLGRVHPHMLRRAFACHMLVASKNIRAVQDLLGHDNVGTTQLYTHLTIEQLKATHEQTHPHEQKRGRDAKRKR